MRVEGNLFLPLVPGVEFLTIDTEVKYLLESLVAAYPAKLLINEHEFDLIIRGIRAKAVEWGKITYIKNPLHINCFAVHSVSKSELLLLELGFMQLKGSQTKIAMKWSDTGRKALRPVLAWLHPFEGLIVKGHPNALSETPTPALPRANDQPPKRRGRQQDPWTAKAIRRILDGMNEEHAFQLWRKEYESGNGIDLETNPTSARDLWRKNVINKPEVQRYRKERKKRKE